MAKHLRFFQTRGKRSSASNLQIPDFFVLLLNASLRRKKRERHARKTTPICKGKTPHNTGNLIGRTCRLDSTCRHSKQAVVVRAPATENATLTLLPHTSKKKKSQLEAKLQTAKYRKCTPHIFLSIRSPSDKTDRYSPRVAPTSTFSPPLKIWFISSCPSSSFSSFSRPLHPHHRRPRSPPPPARPTPLATLPPPPPPKSRPRPRPPRVLLLTLLALMPDLRPHLSLLMPPRTTLHPHQQLSRKTCAVDKKIVMLQYLSSFHPAFISQIV